MPNTIQKLRLEADQEWNKHFNDCSDAGVWTKLNVNLEDIKLFEISWKLRWIESKLKKHN